MGDGSGSSLTAKAGERLRSPGYRPCRIAYMTDLTSVIDGRTWRTYACSYESADGRFSFEIMALSMEHAVAMLEELKATAKLDGELKEVLPWQRP